MHEQERTGAKQSGYHLDNKSVHKLTEENGSIGTNEHCTRTSVKCTNKKELEQRIMRNKNESVLEIISHELTKENGSIGTDERIAEYATCYFVHVQVLNARTRKNCSNVLMSQDWGSFGQQDRSRTH